MASNLTAEQTRAIDAYRRGDNLVLEAGAGCGKTFTLVQMAEAMRGKRGTYTAFNKKVIDDATPRFNSRQVRVRTTHSLAYRTHGLPFAHRLNAKTMLNTADLAQMLHVRDTGFDTLGGNVHVIQDNQMVALANRAVRRFTSSADFGLHAGHVPWVPELTGPDAIDNAEYRAAVLAIAHRIWADLNSKQGRTRFTHDVYRKMWQLTLPRLSGDFVMLDEAQDTPPVVEDVFRRQTHMQRIAVGDSAQAIYGWTGAIDALQSLAADGATKLNLTQSFRFGPAIAAVANEWLAKAESDLRLRGTDRVDSTVEQINDTPDAVICRTNVGAFGEVAGYVLAGVPTHMVGGGKILVAMARGAQALMDNRRPTFGDLACFSTWDEAVAASQEEDADNNLRLLVSLVNSHGTQGVIDIVDRLVEPHRAKVTVSTCHKAKGSEWGRVRIGGDFAAKSEQDKANVRNLEAYRVGYVAVTRAKNTLDLGPLDESRIPVESLFA